MNNRDLGTMKVDLQQSARMRSRIPTDRVMVAESGIRSAEQVATLMKDGVDVFLIGEFIAQSADPELILKQLRGTA